MGSRLSALWGAIALCVACAGSATAQEMRIQFAEKVSIAVAPGVTEFDAHGRRFSLALESNERLTAKLPAARKARLGGSRFLRGRIAGIDGSWVRLAEVGGRVEGAIWDGRELYVVSSLEDAAPHLALPLAGEPGDTVVYRLADTVDVLPRQYCAVANDDSPAAANGLTQYKTLLEDISATAAAANIAYGQLDVALIADSSFQLAESADPAAAMLARLNTADGIFSAQLGLLLNAAEVRAVPAGADPFTQLDPDQLLAQLKAYRGTAPAVPMNRVAHLVTGKALTNGVLGIATIDNACQADAVSLSVGTRGAFPSGLVMAHELAHNLGAVHDGTGACAGEASVWLMAANYNGSARFSACSLATLRPKIAAASCVVPVSIADVLPALAAPAIVQRNVPFAITFTLQSTGALVAQNATAAFALPGDVFVESVVPSAGTCTADAQPTCSFGDIAAGDQRTVTLTVRATTEINQRTVTVTAAASNDRVPENNGAFVDFGVVNESDAAISVSPGLASVRVDDPVEYTITVRALRSQPTRNIRVSASVMGLRNFSFTPSAGTCTAFGDCSLGDLAPGQTATVLVRAVANDAGDRNLDARLDSLDDTNGSNNVASFRLTVGARVNVAVDRPTAGNLQIGVNDTASIAFTVRNTLGTQDAAGVTVTLFASAFAPIESVSVAGGTCAIESGNKATCVVGALAVGESRIVTVGVRGALVAQSDVTARVAATRDDSFADNEARVGVAVRNAVDLRLQAPFWPERFESRNAVETVTLLSNSLNAATDFALTVELAPEARLTSLAMADATCTLIDARHGRCVAASLPHQISRTISIGAVGDSPGAKTVTVAFTAATEADTSDNQVSFDLRVAPYADVSVTPFTLPEVLKLGETYSLTTRLRTAYRDVAPVLFTIAYPPELEVTPPADLTDCTLRHDISGLSDSLDCRWPLIAANTDRPLTFQLRPLRPLLGGRLSVQAMTSGDPDLGNNGLDRTVRLTEDSDLVLDVAAASAGGTVGATFTLPRITLRSPRDAVNMVVKVPIPAFATIDQVATGWICTGTVVLECNVNALVAGTETTFDVTLRANAAGTFTSKVEVIATNDSNTANNVKDVVITVNAPVTGGGSASGGGGSSGGGKGGGRLEWLALALLGALVARRLGRRNVDHTAAGPTRSVGQQIRVAHERHMRPIR